MTVTEQAFSGLETLEIKLQGYNHLSPNFYRGCTTLCWSYNPKYEDAWAKLFGENLPRMNRHVSTSLCEKAGDTLVTLAFQMKGKERVESGFLLAKDFVSKQMSQAEELAPVSDLLDHI